MTSDLPARFAAYQALRSKYPDALPAGQYVLTGSRIIIAGDSIPTLTLDIPLGTPGTPTLDEALDVFGPPARLRAARDLGDPAGGA